MGTDLNLGITKVGQLKIMNMFLQHINDPTELERTTLSRLYPAVFLLLGLLFGFSSYMAHWDAAQQTGLSESVMLGTFLITGIVTLLAYYYSICAIIWAMSKLVGGKNRYLRFVRVSANAIPPLWFSLPILNYFMVKGIYGIIPTVGVSVAVLLAVWSLFRLTAVVSIWFQLSKNRAITVMLLSALFLGSFLYIQFG
jgi:hypothetical protein